VRRTTRSSLDKMDMIWLDMDKGQMIAIIIFTLIASISFLDMIGVI
jgi:hypothetical protein